MVQLPLTILHVPVPVTGVLPDMVVVVTLHRSWSLPALAVVAGTATFITTVDVLAAQGLLLMLHNNTVLLPLLKPLTALVADVLLAIVHVPL